MIIYCCKCRKHVNAELTTGQTVYPHRTDLYKNKYYICPHCKSYVGCHNNTTRPLGCIPTNELKIARRKLHNKMDPLWKEGKISRKELYNRISKELGYTYHNGQTKTVQECLFIYDIIDKIEKEI